MGLDIETMPLVGLLPHFNVGFRNLDYVYNKLIVSKIRNPTYREVNPYKYTDVLRLTCKRSNQQDYDGEGC